LALQANKEALTRRSSDEPTEIESLLTAICSTDSEARRLASHRSKVETRLTLVISTARSGYPGGEDAKFILGFG
jgi:hypothetical protein